MRPLDTYIKIQLTRYLDTVGDALASDVVAILSPIVPGLELRLRDAIDRLQPLYSTIQIGGILTDEQLT